MDFETYVEKILEVLDDFNDNFGCPLSNCNACKYQEECEAILLLRRTLKASMEEFVW